MPGETHRSRCIQRCGKRLARRVAFQTWHKTGTKLATFFANEVSLVCEYGFSFGRPYFRLATRPCHWMLIRSGLNGNTLVGQKPANETVFIHFIRNPFDIVASAYTFHRRGQECDTGQFRRICKEIAELPLAQGVIQMARLLLRYEIPLMTQQHRALHGRGDTYTSRLERCMRPLKN